MEAIGEIVIHIFSEIIFPFIGAPIRWAFFMGKKSWKEIFEDTQNYNAIIGAIIFFGGIVLSIYLSQVS